MPATVAMVRALQNLFNSTSDLFPEADPFYGRGASSFSFDANNYPTDYTRSVLDLKSHRQRRPKTLENHIPVHSKNAILRSAHSYIRDISCSARQNPLIGG